MANTVPVSIDLAWTSDFNYRRNPSLGTADFVNKRYNVPFYPAYIDEVYRAADGAPLVHHGEMVSAEFRHSQLVFT